MVKVKDIIAEVEKIAPPELAEEWDNSGLQIGDAEKEVNRLLVTVDITKDIVAKAVAGEYDMILSHHPLIFKGVKSIAAGDVLSDKIIKLIKNDIAVYSAHTSYDSAETNVSDYLGRCLDLENIEEFGGMARFGFPAEDRTAGELFERLCGLLPEGPKAFHGDKDREIETVVVCGGAGAFLIPDVIAAGADLFITGDLKHHEILDALEAGLCLIDAGHYATEAPGMAAMALNIELVFDDLKVDFM